MAFAARHSVLVCGLLLTALLLAGIWIADASDRFGPEIAWSTSDVLWCGGVLAALSIGLDLVATSRRSVRCRIGTGLALLVALLVVFAGLAVGIVRGEGHPANRSVFLVAGLAVTAAVVAGRRPRVARGLLVAAAIVQASVPWIAMAIWSLPLDEGLVRSAIGSAVLAAGFAAAAALVGETGAGARPHAADEGTAGPVAD